MVHERLAMAVALTRTVKYPQYARTEVATVMKSEMLQQVIADPGNIIRSMADVTTSHSKSNDHSEGEGISVLKETTSTLITY